MENTDELGWLIERADSEPSAPWYWAAGQVDPTRSSAWTQNHMAAIRFARRDDAQAVSDRLMKKAGVEVRIADHAWNRRSPAPAPAEIEEDRALANFDKIKDSFFASNDAMLSATAEGVTDEMVERGHAGLDYARAMYVSKDDVRAILSALLPSVEKAGVVGWRPIPTDDETLSYVLRYGSRCRECADHFGVCPKGLPCEPDEARKAIKHVIDALNYGYLHGYLPAARALQSEERDTNG